MSTQTQQSSTSASQVGQSTSQDTAAASSTSGSATKLAEAIDDFLGDLETKFRGISNDVLSKLDDMAERCDRLEAELLMKEAIMAESSGPTGKGKAHDTDQEL